MIGAEGQSLGILSRDEALDAAREAGLDLVEVAPQSRPPVAKIMDYGKFKYQMGKRERETRKKQKGVQIKEVKMGPKVGDHDFNFKRDHGVEFLKEGHKLKVTIKFRGREMSHTELGREILDRMAEALAEVGKVELRPKLEGRNMTMLVSPKAIAPVKKGSDKDPSESTREDTSCPS